MNTRCSVSPPTTGMNRSDSLKENGILLCSSGWASHPPRVVPAGGDFQQTAHRGNRIAILVCTHELVDLGGTEPVSRANQAAAFAKISRSKRS